MKISHQSAMVPVMLVLLVTACVSSDAAQMPMSAAPVPVTVALTGVASAVQPILMAGTLGAKEEMPLSFKIGGVVSQVRAETGQSVREGTVLAELAPTEIAAEVEKAHQARAKAERDLTRARALYRDSVATLEQMQDAATAYEVAASNARIAEFNRQYAVVRAPSAGIVLTREVEPGQLVAPGTPAVRFRTDRRGLVMRGGLPDRDAVKLRIGDQATVRLDAFPDETFLGQVTQIAMDATPGTGTYAIEVAVDTRGRTLASGLVGRVVLLPRSVGRVLTVPVQAIVEAHGDSATLFTLSADRTKAVRLRVHVGVLDGDRVTVLSGLDQGAEVVTAGAAWLADGALVKLNANRSAAPARLAP